MRRASIVLLAMASTACLAPAAPSAVLPSPTPSTTTTTDRPAPPIAAGVDVVRVVDGDTIVVGIDGARETKVRLIGIDTPERNECFYRAATSKMRMLVEDKRVRLMRDVSETDRYGRLLRYVYVGELFVNAVMVSDGYANAATYPPDVAHAIDFVMLERAARAAKRGLWAGGCSL
jgi:micrococcal nuclease